MQGHLGTLQPLIRTSSPTDLPLPLHGLETPAAVGSTSEGSPSILQGPAVWCVGCSDQPDTNSRSNSGVWWWQRWLSVNPSSAASSDGGTTSGMGAVLPAALEALLGTAAFAHAACTLQAVRHLASNVRLGLEVGIRVGARSSWEEAEGCGGACTQQLGHEKHGCMKGWQREQSQQHRGYSEELVLAVHTLLSANPVQRQARKRAAQEAWAQLCANETTSV
jgi:hypothetical protein